MKKKIILTFDLEEFDLPLEYDHPISEEDKIKVTTTGLQRLIGLLSKHNIPATFFTTLFYAERNKELMKSLSVSHEIASHSKRHSDFKETDLSESKLEIEKITGKQVYGFRMPRFTKTDVNLIRSAGYKYDSSINPSFVPGRYNNFFTQRKIHRDLKTNIIVFPVSVTPLIRFPLFWLSFKNLPLQLYLLMCKITLWNDSYLHLYFHPWEFDDLESFNIPGYIKNLSGMRYTERFERMLLELKKAGEFSTISGLIDSAASF